MSGIPPGNNLRSILSGMIVRNVCVLHWGMLRSSGDTHFLKDDSGLTLLGGERCWLAWDTVPC